MTTQFHVNGETTIVTGASQGIGQAIAKKLPQRTVMKHLSEREDLQPVLLGLGIDDLPDAFTVEGTRAIS